MSFPVTCRACGARLKLPPGCTKKKARCPKCGARIDLAAALDAAAYRPTGDKPAKPAKPVDPSAGTPVPSRPPPPPLPEREEDPLPYTDLNPATGPKPAVQTPAPPRPVPPPVPAARPPGEQPLSLDEDAAHAPPTPAGPPPFRVPARVTGDTANLFFGPCAVVLVPHGVFLESVPYRPFLYAPVGSRAVQPTRRVVVVAAPDGRAVTVEFPGRDGPRLAEDVAAFLAGARPVPEAREYRRRPAWLLWLALIFALGLAVAPVVMTQTTELGLETGLLLGAGFAGIGLLANAAVVLLTRLPVFGKVAVMGLVGAAVTGVFLFAATAYLAGRRQAEQAKPDPPEPPNPGTNTPGPQPGSNTPGSPGTPAPRGLPTPVDAAYQDGVFRFEDGPADVTSLAVSPDGSVLIVGYKNGTTRVWRFDQAAIDPFSPGPRCDGPPTRIQVDPDGAVVYLSCNGGTVAALWNDPPESPVKIPGELFAVFPSPGGERFATHRGNGLVVRYLPRKLVEKPPKGKGFVVTGAKDEVTPADAKGPLGGGPRPTFLAWNPGGGRLLAGQPDGTIQTWADGVRAGPAVREHKAAVRAWAACPVTGDFATGDDKGVVGLWASRAATPKTFTAAAGAVTDLAYSPLGWYLAVADQAGFVRVWDLAASRAVVKTSRLGARVTFGPSDDLVLLTAGKAVELWHLPELAKQP